MTGSIYKITNILNGKMYIGKTLHSIQKRFQEHIKDSQKVRYDKRPLYDAMNKYGIENFELTLVENAEAELLDEREKYWIEYYDTYKNGYNATLGGEGKTLYDYDQLIEDYLSGSLIKEVSQHFGCDVKVIQEALCSVNINSQQNARKHTKKQLRCSDKKGFEKFFASRAEAAEWLMAEGKTKASDLDNVVAAIGRAANGKRKTAYGLEWENI